MVEKSSEKNKRNDNVVSPVEDGLQVQPRLLASQPRIQDILSNTGEFYLKGLHCKVVKLFRMKSQN
jgi:hypothetical protein